MLTNLRDRFPKGDARSFWILNIFLVCKQQELHCTCIVHLLDEFCGDVTIVPEISHGRFCEGF